MLNRLHNVKNPHQGSTKKVLCVCSAGLLRSPTAAVVLSSPPFNFNTRAVGIDAEYALVPVEAILLSWADEIVVMSEYHRNWINDSWPGVENKIIVLDIPDQFPYRDPELMRLIAEQYTAKTA